MTLYAGVYEYCKNERNIVLTLPFNSLPERAYSEHFKNNGRYKV